MIKVPCQSARCCCPQEVTYFGKLACQLEFLVIVAEYLDIYWGHILIFGTPISKCCLQAKPAALSTLCKTSENSYRELQACLRVYKYWGLMWVWSQSQTGDCRTDVCICMYCMPVVLKDLLKQLIWPYGFVSCMQKKLLDKLLHTVSYTGWCTYTFLPAKCLCAKWFYGVFGQQVKSRDVLS